MADDKQDTPVRCPKCCSAQIHAEKRGKTVKYGIFGQHKIVITCLKCGHQFKPGQGA